MRKELLTRELQKNTHASSSILPSAAAKTHWMMGKIDMLAKKTSEKINMPAFSGHVPNPYASVAYWYDDPRHDPDQQSLRIEGAVWTASQGKDSVGGMYGLPPEKVSQEGYFQGGKYCDWGFRKVQQITPMLSKRVGRPVRMAIGRKEMYDFNMNQRFSRLKVGFKKNGLITAIDDFSIADAGVPPVSTLGTSGDQGYGPYFTTRCLNIKQSMEIVNSNSSEPFVFAQAGIYDITFDGEPATGVEVVAKYADTAELAAILLDDMELIFSITFFE